MKKEKPNNIQSLNSKVLLCAIKVNSRIRVKDDFTFDYLLLYVACVFVSVCIVCLFFYAVQSVRD